MPDSLLRLQSVERQILELLRCHEVLDLGNLKILEVGCGSGAWLRFLIQAGASPENMFGVDLLEDRLNQARRKCPVHVNLTCGDASQMPFEQESFDLVLGMTVFSSILDNELRHLLAPSMVRLLRRGGSILWYDFFISNPRNPDVRGITKHEIGNYSSTVTLSSIAAH